MRGGPVATAVLVLLCVTNGVADAGVGSVMAADELAPTLLGNAV